MLFGPDIIKQCPLCNNYFAEASLRSGNTFGAIYWTDGKREAPSLPNFPALVKCPHCDAFLWREDVAENQGTISLAGILPYKQLNILDMLKALQSGIASTPSQMRYLRTRLWWAANDRHRNIGKSLMSRTEDKGMYSHEEALRANMNMLAALLSDTSPEERIMKAELMREMGQFGEVARLLAFSFPRQLKHAANRIGALANSGIMQVEKL
jgi:hypothetical protein